MCEPVTIIAALSAVIGIATSAMSYQGQQQAVEDQNRAADLTYGMRQEAISAGAAQADAAQSEDSFDREVERLRAQGRIAASISDMGLGDLSASQLVNVNAFETGRAQSLTDISFQQQRDQLRRDGRGASLERITSQGVKPSSLGLILGIGQGVMQGFNTYGQLGGRYPGGATRQQ